MVQVGFQSWEKPRGVRRPTRSWQLSRDRAAEEEWAGPGITAATPYSHHVQPQGVPGTRSTGNRVGKQAPFAWDGVSWKEGHSTDQVERLEIHITK